MGKLALSSETKLRGVLSSFIYVFQLLLTRFQSQFSIISLCDRVRHCRRFTFSISKDEEHSLKVQCLSKIQSDRLASLHSIFTASLLPPSESEATELGISRVFCDIEVVSPDVHVSIKGTHFS